MMHFRKFRAEGKTHNQYFYFFKKRYTPCIDKLPQRKKINYKIFMHFCTIVQQLMCQDLKIYKTNNTTVTHLPRLR